MPSPSLTVAQILNTARSYLGTGEHPDGSNRTIFNAWYGEQGVAWCAIFVSYCFAHVPGVGAAGLGLIGGKHDYTPDFGRWFYDHTEWGHKPKPGAIVFFNFGDPNYGGRWLGIHHVGIVEGVQSDGRVVTIEGNTDNAVRRRVRSPADIAGYGYPAYAISTMKTVRIGLGKPKDIMRILIDLDDLRTADNKTRIARKLINKHTTPDGFMVARIGPTGGTNPATIETEVRLIIARLHPKWARGKVQIIAA